MQLISHRPHLDGYFAGRLGGRHFYWKQMMKLARRPLEDPERLIELEQQLEDHMNEVLAEAADAGYSSAELLMAFKVVCDRQHKALEEDPDPAEDPT